MMRWCGRLNKNTEKQQDKMPYYALKCPPVSEWGGKQTPFASRGCIPAALLQDENAFQTV
jgi:hypothetical protein